MCPAIELWEQIAFVARPLCHGFFSQVLKTSPHRGGAAEILI
jgi:hypothetical protein